MLLAKSGYAGEVRLRPANDFAVLEPVFIDGSVSQAGGAAPFCSGTREVLTRRVSALRSSIHYELLGLLLAIEFRLAHIVTDSLVALVSFPN